MPDDTEPPERPAATPDPDAPGNFVDDDDVAEVPEPNEPG